jgi:NAD-reducing hydrogenase large subunit
MSRKTDRDFPGHPGRGARQGDDPPRRCNRSTRRGCTSSSSAASSASSGPPDVGVPVIVQRLCGICPVSHHLAAAKAMDRIVGVDTLPPTAEKMRRLMHYGQIMQSMCCIFSTSLTGPDVRFRRRPCAKTQRLRSAQGAPGARPPRVLMRKFGQEIIEATAGKKVHGTGAVPVASTGTCRRAATHFLADRRDGRLGDGRPALARDYRLEHLDTVADFADFPSPYMSLARSATARSISTTARTAAQHDRDGIFDRHRDYERLSRASCARTCAAGPT